VEPFELPEDLTAVEDLAPLLEAALAEYGELAGLADDVITDEQIDRLDYLGTAVDAIQAENTVREEAATERTARLTAAREKLAAATAAGDGTENDEPDPGAEEGDEADPEADASDLGVEIPDDASELEESEAVIASGAANKSVVRRAARRAPIVKKEPKAAELNVATMFASTDLPNFSVGQQLATLDDVADAFAARFKGMPQTRITNVSQKFGVASIRKKINPATHITRKTSGQDASMIIENAAKDVSRLDDAIVAAGGWCAPSTTVYNLPGIETISGILSMPEVTIEHGGINFTKGPDYGAVYADADSWFMQTETQAEAGTTKALFDVECPDFEEVRLDAIGFGLRAGILTNAAWPELIKRYEQILITGFAHRVNAQKIARIVTDLGAAVTAGTFGAATTDALDALAMQATRLRYKYSLAPTAVIEGFAPVWALEVFRADLSRQNGVDRLSVTDAQIAAYFAVRNIRLQFVYDWQNLAATGTTWPTTVQVALYTPGAYVAGTADVIQLDAIYDTVDIKVNTYTGMFMEEGIMVFNPVGSGVLVTLSTTAAELSGATGFPAIGAGEGVTIPAVI
jgi:hypothetical protein